MKAKALFSFTLASLILVSSQQVHADEITELESKKAANQEKKSQLETELGTVKSEMSSLEVKIQSLNTEIAKNLDDIRSTENSINKVQGIISETESKIQDTEKELEKKQNILSENLRVLYSQGKVSYIEFLFRSENMDDFMYRFNSMNDLAKANEALYKEIKIMLAELEKQKKILVEEKASLDKKAKELQSLKDALALRQKEQLTAIAKLSAQKADLDKNIAEQDAAIASINGDIANIIRQREEARRQQELARKQAQNVSSGSSSSSNNYGNEIESSGQFALPMRKGSYYISSYYGWRTHPVTGDKKLHNGVDFAAAQGTPMYAVDNGTVLFSGPASGYGHWIVIDHNNGFYSIYGHMFSNQLYVAPGQIVTKGQHIADVGNDGTSTGAHLHFSLANGFRGGTFSYVDPMAYF